MGEVMSTPVIAFLGGNGHSSWRLAAARDALAEGIARGEIAPMRLEEARYPGFEDRPAATDLCSFLATTAETLQAPSLVLATGIGGLLALCLRSAGHLEAVPLVLHAPVLWGLERRWMPRLVRASGLARLLPALFRTRAYQRRFVRRQFLGELSDEQRRAFFDGYARCAAFADLFQWLTPALLRTLEQRFAAHPARLDRIRVWWGSEDRVVGREELSVTEAALGRRFPLEVFEGWGHYPMIEDPQGFIRALAAEVHP